ncbi:MAG: toprim domain-containing protein [candidate division WOR-3 bacterium]|nr:toprim domain-containing protein [candidate division WOR-3 bacterium]
METRDHLAEIYQLMDIETALPELNAKDRGGYYELDCPGSGDDGRGQARICKDDKGHILCNRLDEYAKPISLWDYVQKRDKLTPADTLKRLAELAGYALLSLDSETQARIRTVEEQASLLEAIADFFKAQMWTPRGRAVLDYLKGRGYSEQELKGTEIGAFPPQGEITRFLASINVANPSDTLYALGLAGHGLGETHKLAIPYRGPAGRLKGFAVRTTDPRMEPKYLYTGRLERDTLFNLHQTRASGQSELILVEGYMDALMATGRGLPGVVALGAACLTEKQLEDALRCRTKRFTLALNNDAGGQNGTEQTLDLLDRRGIPGFVVTLPKDCKDPDELMKVKGIDAFKQLVEQAENGGSWRATRLLGKHDLSTARGRRAAVDEAIVIAEQLSPPDVQVFMDWVTNATDMGEGLFEAYLENYRQRHARERLSQGYEAFLKDGGRLLADGKIEDLGRLFDEQGKELGAKTTARAPSPYVLGNFLAEIAETPEGLKTGYPGLDRLFAIPRAATTIVAGRPSHGKTATLLNLMANMSGLYKDKTFVLFSYEEQRRYIGLKLLNILCGKVILSGEIKDPDLNLRELEGYLRAGRTDRPAIEWGKAELSKLLNSGRVLLADEPYSVEDWADALTALSGRCSIGAVFVDYVQKVRTRDKYHDRQAELQRISERVLETARSLGLPVILGAQLGRDPMYKEKVRLDDFREAGGIERDAGLVLGLFNPAVEKAQDGGEPVKEPVVDLKVTVLRNRDGAVNESEILDFNRPLFTLSSKDGSYQANP